LDGFDYGADGHGGFPIRRANISTDNVAMVRS
jgi:hypothetical protein